MLAGITIIYHNSSKKIDTIKGCHYLQLSAHDIIQYCILLVSGLIFKVKFRVLQKVEDLPGILEVMSLSDLDKAIITSCHINPNCIHKQNTVYIHIKHFIA